MTIRDATYATALAIMVGWLMLIGKPVLMPILASLITVYILSEASRSMEAVPVLGRLPGWVRRALVLIAFAVFVVFLFVVIMENLTQVVNRIAKYEDNLDALVNRGAAMIGIQDEPSWASLRKATFDQINFRNWIAPVLFSLQGFGTLLFLMVLYSAFFMAERGALARKLVMAVGDSEQGERMLDLLARINERIGSYLFVKTLLNAVLGALSYVVMLVLGIEFALFWAVLIAFLNYVPYLGSLAGVFFPVVLALAQFGSIAMGAVVLFSLGAIQVFVGAVMEPRMMGQAFNLSPLVVLLALAVWSALWGLPGAVLAVPMTASLVLVLAEIRPTRPLAVMLSANGRV